MTQMPEVGAQTGARQIRLNWYTVPFSGHWKYWDAAVKGISVTVGEVIVDSDVDI
jgi:ABC-type transporter MlaC component